MRFAGFVLVFSLLGCSGVEEVAPGPAQPAQPDPTVQTESSVQTVALRLLGARAPGAVRVQVGSVDATVDGQSIPVKVDGSEVDLGTADHAWQVATFTPPAEATELELNLHFLHDASVEKDGQQQPLEMQGAPISIFVKVADVRLRNKIVIELDLERSLAEHAGRLFLLPTFVVHF